MPKVAGKVIKSGEKDGKFLALIQLNGKFPKAGEAITCKWGRTRTNSQNSLYWIFLQWLLDAGLKEEYGTADELHESLKAAFLSKQNSLGLLKIGSTTELGKADFGEYIDKINLAMIENCGINTEPFWSEYELNYGVN